MPSHHNALPDLAFGHHSAHGIVAANPKNLAAGTWMLKGFGFHPIPDQPNLYALAEQERDGPSRTAHAVTLLRKAGYRVDVDAAFDPASASDAAPVRDRVPLSEPDVAFAEHPRLGIVAAIDDRASRLTGPALTEDGWRHNPNLDIYTLPAITARDEALEKVAATTLSLHRSGVRVAVQPRLAQDVAARPRPTTATTTFRENSRGTSRASPLSAAALATSPASGGLAGKAPIPTPTTPSAAARPVDPRITFSRPR